MSEGSSAAADSISWFTHDRFGMFIHWGLYSLAARGEWVRYHERLTDQDYRKYFDHFDPDLYDPAVWAREARNAGMKYFVVTTKHHDGFCLWDSQLTDYQTTNTPHGKDLIRPMVEAFRAEGLRVGFYHSLVDWHHPQFPLDGLYPRHDDLEFREQARQRDITLYREYLHGQVQELLTRFGPIDIMWFDFSYSERDFGWSKGKGKDDWDSDGLRKLVRRLQPEVIINDRLDVGWSEGSDFYTPQVYQLPGPLMHDGKPVIWQTCQPMRRSWGYVRDDPEWRSADELICMLIDTVAKDGNLLLNVGPTARGELDMETLERLRAFGEWMRLHNRAIYGCGASSFTPPPGCCYTQNGNRLYLHLLTWPYRHVHLPDLADRVAYAQLLHNASEVEMRVLDPEGAYERKAFVIMGEVPPNTLTLELPLQQPKVTVPVIELFLKE